MTRSFAVKVAHVLTRSSLTPAATPVPLRLATTSLHSVLQLYNRTWFANVFRTSLSSASYHFSGCPRAVPLAQQKVSQDWSVSSVGYDYTVF
jgi:hypothetical protein